MFFVRFINDRYVFPKIRHKKMLTSYNLYRSAKAVKISLHKKSLQKNNYIIFFACIIQKKAVPSNICLGFITQTKP